MIPKLALTGLIALALCAPVKEAAAQDAVGGAIVGGVLGGIVGGAVGGGRGAAVGAIVGAGTGAAIAAQGEPRPGGYRFFAASHRFNRLEGQLFRNAREAERAARRLLEGDLQLAS